MKNKLKSRLEKVRSIKEKKRCDRHEGYSASSEDVKPPTLKYKVRSIKDKKRCYRKEGYSFSSEEAKSHKHKNVRSIKDKKRCYRHEGYSTSSEEVETPVHKYRKVSPSTKEKGSKDSEPLKDSKVPAKISVEKEEPPV